MDIKNIQIPKRIKKLISKYGEQFRVKLMILHNYEDLPQTFFEHKFLEANEMHLDFTSDQNEFWFKIGVAVGHKTNTLVYTLDFEQYEVKLMEKCKFLLMEEPSEIEIETDPSFGMLEVKALNEIENFDQKTIQICEETHFKNCFPERTNLEELLLKDGTLDEILRKISKQFNNVKSMDISKFTNTCSNLIKQHLSSSKVKVGDMDLYKDYLLANVLEELFEKDVID